MCVGTGTGSPLVAGTPVKAAGTPSRSSLAQSPFVRSFSAAAALTPSSQPSVELNKAHATVVPTHAHSTNTHAQAFNTPPTATATTTQAHTTTTTLPAHLQENALVNDLLFVLVVCTPFSQVDFMNRASRENTFAPSLTF